MSFLRRLEVYAPKHSAFEYVHLIGIQLVESALVLGTAVLNKTVLVSQLKLVVFLSI